MASVVTLLGPIGSGKTSQAHTLSREYHLPMFSVGQLIREDTNPEAHEAMARGDISPTKYVQELVLRRFSEITTDQAILFDAKPLPAEIDRYVTDLPKYGHKYGLVVVLDVDEDEVMHRIGQRYQHHKRADDHPDTIANRLRVYKEKTLPTLDHYRKLGIPVEMVDGNGTQDEVTERLSKVLRTHGIITD